MSDEEMVDIVDENNNFLYSSSKSEAHHKGLLHQTVIAEYINSKGQWCMVKQASDRQDAGQFVNPVGGHVRSGETLIEALKREASEEIGIEDAEYKYVDKAIYNRNILGRQENHYFILYEIYCDKEPCLNKESASYQWFSLDELKKEIKNNPKVFGDGLYFVLKNFYPALLE